MQYKEQIATIKHKMMEAVRPPFMKADGMVRMPAPRKLRTTNVYVCKELAPTLLPEEVIVMLRRRRRGRYV
jgi:hypothetical protein